MLAPDINCGFRLNGKYLVPVPAALVLLPYCNRLTVVVGKALERVLAEFVRARKGIRQFIPPCLVVKACNPSCAVHGLSLRLPLADFVGASPYYRLEESWLST